MPLQTTADPFRLDLANTTFPADAPKLGDRSVVSIHSALAGQQVLLLVTGGIAAYKTPGLIRMLRSYGAEVDVRATENAGEFIGHQSLRWAAETGTVLTGSHLTGDVEHLQKYSVYLVAPATYDFINGMAHGRADTPALTTMATAIGRVANGSAKMLVLPCMNGDMSNGILKNSIKLLSDMGVEFIAPRTGNGKLEYPGSEFITVATARHVSSSSLKGSSILLTAGPTPVPIDDVRRITNIFKGKLGREIAKELIIRGANPTFLLGGGLGVPNYVELFTRRYRSFDEYKTLVLEHGTDENVPPALAILSSAVADYRPKEVHQGKITSKSPELMLPPFEPTEKIVELLHQQAAALPIISFKLLSRVTKEDLIAEARSRTSTHSALVVANRLEDCSGDNQIVYLVTKESEKRVEGSKRDVAVAIVDAAQTIIETRNKNA
jgi:phosphopantothenoylcysteine decarboxylase/phosphopantothenate--cysteine ligase